MSQEERRRREAEELRRRTAGDDDDEPSFRLVTDEPEREDEPDADAA